MNIQHNILIKPDARKLNETATPRTLSEAFGAHASGRAFNGEDEIGWKRGIAWSIGLLSPFALFIWLGHIAGF